jgi:RNase P protein component
VFAVSDACWRLLKDTRQPRLALKERQAGDGRAVERHQIKGEINESGRAGVASHLHQRE